MKRRLREGARLIVVDPRRIDLVKIAARSGGLSFAAAARHERRRHQCDGARGGHRGSGGRNLRQGALRHGSVRAVAQVHRRRPQFAGSDWKPSPACRLPICAARRGSTRPAATPPFTTDSVSPSTARARPWSWAWRISPWPPATSANAGVGVNPLRGQNNVQGSCDMGSFPHEFSGLPARLRRRRRGNLFEEAWGVPLQNEPGLRISNMLDAAVRRHVQGHLHPGRGHRAVRSEHAARHRRA